MQLFPPYGTVVSDGLDDGDTSGLIDGEASGLIDGEADGLGDGDGTAGKAFAIAPLILAIVAAFRYAG